MAIRQLSERFLVAFSFAGEQHELMRSIAEAVEQGLVRGAVFWTHCRGSFHENPRAQL